MSNVSHLDATTRALLRQAIDRARRAKTGATPKTMEREQVRNRKQQWREQNREREREHNRAYRRRLREKAGLPPSRNENFERGLCAKGLHRLTTGNLAGTGTSGKRRCAACNREYQRERKRRIRAEMTPDQLAEKREKASAYYREYRKRKREAA